MEEEFNSKPKFLKYHVITFPGTDINKELNAIIADKEIKETIGQPGKISKMNKNSLLIEILSENQLRKLNTLKRIAGQLVTIQAHRSLNCAKGTVYSETLSLCTDGEILEALEGQGVIKVDRIKKRIDGELHNTPRLILTFNNPRIPRAIKIAEWQREFVNVYIPKPMKCNNCIRFGHTKKYCRRETQSCSNCSGDGHLSKDCTEEPFCINCSGDHPPTSKECPTYKIKCEILATQARQNLTYHEAREIVHDRFIHTEKTYSQALTEPAPKPIRNAIGNNTENILSQITGMETDFNNETRLR